MSRILLAEDEIAIALDFEAALKEAGFKVIGPAYGHEDAARRISGESFEAAVIDFGVALRAPEDVLLPLVSRSIPIVILTGYEHPALPDWLSPVSICLKPCSPTDLIETLQAVLPDGGHSPA